MKTEITVIFDSDRPKNVNVAGTGDPWQDLGYLIEGVGVLVAACLNTGKVEHKGQSVESYLKDYIGKVCNNYHTMSLVKK